MQNGLAFVTWKEVDAKLIPEGTTPQTIVLSQVSKASDLDTCPSFSQQVPSGKKIKRQIRI